MMNFTRVVSQSEVNKGYLNLTDEYGRTHGLEFPAQHKTPLAIVDADGRIFAAKKHHRNQIWGDLSKWFDANDIRAGMRIGVRHDPGEQRDGRPVVYLIPEVQQSHSIWESAQSIPDEISAIAAPEIPLALEKQLEDFLAVNLTMIEPGLKLYKDEDGRDGKQYPTDVGVIDLLCVRPDGSLVVIELKRGRGSDLVVGQISRYMGFVKEDISEGKPVSGLILAHDRDDNLKYAVAANPSISLRYFKLRLDLVTEAEL